MMLTITSPTLGYDITFYRPHGAFIRADIGGQRVELCERGSLVGEAIYYLGDSKQAFAKVCRKWYRSHLANRH